MKIRMKLFSTLVIGLLMSMCFVNITAASETCYEAAIVQAAVVPDDSDPTTSPYVIKLDCNNPSNLWVGARQFDMSSDLGDSGYATILTAISLGQTVRVQLASTSWHALIEKIYLNAPTTP